MPDIEELVSRLAEEDLSRDEVRCALLHFLWERDEWSWFGGSTTARNLRDIDRRLGHIEERIGEAKCRAPGDPEAGGIMNLVTGPDRADGRETLRDWLHDCEVLEIADPYFFRLGSYKHPSDLIEKFDESSPTVSAPNCRISRAEAQPAPNFGFFAGHARASNKNAVFQDSGSP